MGITLKSFVVRAKILGIRLMDSFQKQVEKVPKDILLGIVDKIGELRDAVKLEEDINLLREDLEDNIDDIYWFLALLATGNGVVIDEMIEKIVKMKKK